MAYGNGDIGRAIKAIDNTIEFMLFGEIYENIVWRKGFISKSDLETKITAMQNDYNSKQ